VQVFSSFPLPVFQNNHFYCEKLPKNEKRCNAFHSNPVKNCIKINFQISLLFLSDFSIWSVSPYICKVFMFYAFDPKWSSFNICCLYWTAHFQVCFVKEYITHAGEIRFKTGCLDKLVYFSLIIIFVYFNKVFKHATFQRFVLLMLLFFVLTFRLCNLYYEPKVYIVIHLVLLLLLVAIFVLLYVPSLFVKQSAHIESAYIQSAYITAYITFMSVSSWSCLKLHVFRWAKIIAIS
jgi:hypothetical protein